MRIGVITYWESNDNYGQQLQCWAMQHYLREKGHDAFLIRQYVWPPATAKKKGIKRIKQCVKDCLAWMLYWSGLAYNANIARYFSFCLDKEICRRQFPLFRKRNLKMSKIYNPQKKLTENPPRADIYIAGSDQIWNYDMSEDAYRNYFLQFGDKSAKRISYAPSIAQNELTEEIKPVIKEYLKAFSAISVRETSAVKLLEELGYNVQHVLDPSMLLTAEDYLGLAKGVDSKSNVFIYSMNYGTVEDLPFLQIRKYAQKRNIPIIVTPGSGYIPAQELFDDVEYSYATIPQWIQHVAHSELVVTASFHGIVFAIIFHRPFIYTPVKGEFSVGNQRVTDLLLDLGLDNRIWDDKNMNAEEILNSEIDWNQVESKLSLRRTASCKFLLNAIENE